MISNSITTNTNTIIVIVIAATTTVSYESSRSNRYIVCVGKVMPTTQI